jgi:exonuclease III
MKGKLNELMLHLSKFTPDIIYVTEHHLNASEIELTYLPSYILGANFCREKLKKGGACIYIHEDLKFPTIKVQIWAKEQDLEIAAVQIKLKRVKLIIITVYRAPVGNFDYFLCKLDAILKFLYQENIEFLICGDINVNYLENNSKRTQLDEMLRTYNLISAVNFPTRITKTTATLIDNIVIDSSRDCDLKPYVNGLSDHNAQLVVIKNVKSLKLEKLIKILFQNFKPY